MNRMKPLYSHKHPDTQVMVGVDGSRPPPPSPPPPPPPLLGGLKPPPPGPPPKLCGVSVLLDMSLRATKYFQIFLAGLKYGVCRIWYEKARKVSEPHLEQVNVSLIGR